MWRSVALIASRLYQMAKHNVLGREGEDLAIAHLQGQGYILRERNWRSGRHELDIIMLSEDLTTVVFVEVKTRTDARHADPEDSVHAAKIRNIGMAAHAYIIQKEIVEEVRFDLITILLTDGRDPIITHTVDAFNPLLL